MQDNDGHATLWGETPWSRSERIGQKSVLNSVVRGRLGLRMRSAVTGVGLFLFFVVDFRPRGTDANASSDPIYFYQKSGPLTHH